MRNLKSGLKEIPLRKKIMGGQKKETLYETKTN